MARASGTTAHDCWACRTRTPSSRTSPLTVRAALADLPADQRAAVVLRHWLGYDVDETARLLGIPAATVRTRTFPRAGPAAHDARP